MDCSNAPEWDSGAIYENAGMRVVYNGNLYENNWYSRGQNPGENPPGEFEVWTLIGPCDSDIKDIVPAFSFITSDGTFIVVDAATGELIH